MNKDEKNKISEIISIIIGLFHENILNLYRGNEKGISYQAYEIYHELLKIKDTKYLKIVDKNLINYIYNNDFLKFNVNIKDPIYFTKFIKLYIDYIEHGNYVYRNMSRYIYFMYLKELKLSHNNELNMLIQEYHEIVKDVYKSHKLNLEEIQMFCRLLVFLLTYLYMNSELLENNKKIFYDTYKILINDSFFEEMKMNGAFNNIGTIDEENTKIYFIEKAIKKNIKKKELK